MPAHYKMNTKGNWGTGPHPPLTGGPGRGRQAMRRRSGILLLLSLGRSAPVQSKMPVCLLLLSPIVAEK